MNQSNPPRDRAPAVHKRGDTVAMLHELYAIYPHERHEVLAQALLQARRNTPRHEGMDGIQREVGRLLGLQTILNLKARERGESSRGASVFIHPPADATVRLSRPNCTPRVQP